MDRDDAMRALCDANAGRAAFYRVLAGYFYQELKEDDLEALRARDLLAGVGEGPLRDGLKAMQRYLRGKRFGARQELASDYARTFLAADTYDERRATPYESVFTSAEGLLMQDARDDVYRRFCEEGLAVDTAEAFVPEDHLSFEFEFMALMCDKANDALARGDVAEAARALRVQRDFSTDHQLNWIAKLCDTVEAVARTSFYRGLSQVTRAFVHDDAQTIASLVEVAEGLEAPCANADTAWCGACGHACVA